MIKSFKSYGSITECYVFSPEQPGIYPSITWLHGLNSSWNGNPGGVGAQMNSGMNVPFVVYNPNNPNQADWSKNEITDVKHIVEAGNHPFNIVCGYSQGGIGTISAINFYPSFWKYAGICAGKTALTGYTKFIDTKMRNWQSVNDPVVGTGSITNFIKGVAAAGGDATQILYDKVTHDYCPWAFDPNFEDGFWNWIAKYFPPIHPAEEKETVTNIEVLNSEILFTTNTGNQYKISATKI